MFGFSLAAQLFQGSAQRTWNCVTQYTNLLWYKFNHYRYPEMPRTRRRHHSRSRSRSRSHSHDRDRDVKRRKIDNVDSPAQKRSVSSEPQSPEHHEVTTEKTKDVQQHIQDNEVSNVDLGKNKIQDDSDSHSSPKKTEEQENPSTSSVHEKSEKPIKQIEEKLTITPKKTDSPKQIQKRLESEKKRQQKQEEQRKKQEERERLRLEKEQVKKEKDELMKKKNEQKAKEREMKEEQKRKEREEKEAKRKEKEEREEAKRKEREQEKLKKQQEVDEKNREKQKLEEQKKKSAQVFANFFVAKKTESKLEDEGKTKLFMPFEVKSDMRLAPMRREPLTDDEKQTLTESLNNGDASYLKNLKSRKIKKCSKTWPFEEDVVIIEEDFGESICEDKQKTKKMRVKFLKFRENRRPAFYGTWRKKSGVIHARNPLVEDKSFFDYEVDSDDDWEEEEQGESLNGSDDEEKEKDDENDEYEVDNDFFVPHGHLSDDEIDDEASAKLSPESHKQKLKLLKDEFDQDMQMKTNRMKPRSIGCIWYSKSRSNVDDSIDRHLRPLAIITNGHIIIAKRNEFLNGNTPSRRQTKELRPEYIPTFLKLIQGNLKKKKTIVEEFINYMKEHDNVVEVSKSYLLKCLKQYAQWKKCVDEGPLFNKYCWCLEEEVKKKYNFE